MSMVYQVFNTLENQSVYSQIQLLVTFLQKQNVEESIIYFSHQQREKLVIHVHHVWNITVIDVFQSATSVRKHKQNIVAIIQSEKGTRNMRPITNTNLAYIATKLSIFGGQQQRNTRPKSTPIKNMTPR